MRSNSAKSTWPSRLNGAWNIPTAQVAKSFKEVHGEKGDASIYPTSESRYGRQYTHALQQLRILQAGREKPAPDDPEFLTYPKKTFFRTKIPLTLSIHSISIPKNKPEKPDIKPESWNELLSERRA